MEIRRSLIVATVLAIPLLACNGDGGTGLDDDDGQREKNWINNGAPNN